MIPRTTLPTREIENRAMSTSLEVFESEHPVFELASVVDTETLNNGTRLKRSYK